MPFYEDEYSRKRGNLVSFTVRMESPSGFRNRFSRINACFFALRPGTRKYELFPDLVIFPKMFGLLEYKNVASILHARTEAAANPQDTNVRERPEIP